MAMELIKQQIYVLLVLFFSLAVIQKLPLKPLKHSKSILSKSTNQTPAPSYMHPYFNSSMSSNGTIFRNQQLAQNKTGGAKPAIKSQPIPPLKWDIEIPIGENKHSFRNYSKRGSRIIIVIDDLA